MIKLAKKIVKHKKIIVALFPPKGADHIFYLGRNIYRVFNGFVIGKIVEGTGVVRYAE